MNYRSFNGNASKTTHNPSPPYNGLPTKTRAHEDVLLMTMYLWITADDLWQCAGQCPHHLMGLHWWRTTKLPCTAPTTHNSIQQEMTPTFIYKYWPGKRGWTKRVYPKPPDWRLHPWQVICRLRKSWHGKLSNLRTKMWLHIKRSKMWGSWLQAKCWLW